MDFTALKEQILCYGNGTVVARIISQRGLGKHIIIDHGFGYTSIYAHLVDFNVRVGRRFREAM